MSHTAIKITKPEAFGLQAAARLLGVSESTMRRWIRAKRMHAFKVGPKLWHVELSELRRVQKAR